MRKEMYTYTTLAHLSLVFISIYTITVMSTLKYNDLTDRKSVV